MKKRILSLLLTLAMVLTLVPVAFATGDDAAQDANSTEAVDTAQVEPQEDAAGEDASVTTAEDTTIVENPVAKIGDTEYATLQGAVDAAAKGATIEVLQDINVGTKNISVYDKKANVVLDLGGHTITGSGERTMSFSSNNWTLQNGKVVNTSASSYGTILFGTQGSTTLGGTGTLTIENTNAQGVALALDKIPTGTAEVTVKDGTTISSKHFGASLAGTTTSGKTGKAVLNIEGGEINGGTAAIAVYGAATGSPKAGVIVNVTGGKVSSDTGYAIAGNGTPVYADTTINISGGEVVSAKDTAIYHPQAGTVSISGGTVSGVTGGIQMCSGSLEVTGGTITATGNGDVSGKTGDGSIPDGAAVSVVSRNYPAGTPSATINGGTLTSASGVDAVQAYTWASNAKADWADAKSNTSISGGTFSSDISDYCVSGYEPAKSEDGTYTVEDHRIAEIDGVGYASMQKAVDAAKDGDTIKMLADVDLAQTVVVSDKTITLNMNGNKLYNTKNLWDVPEKADNNWSLLSVRGTGDLTITGEGTLKALENDCYAVDVQDGATLTVENGTFVGNIHAVYVQKGAAYIKGGTYSIQQTYYPDASKAYEFVLNLYDANRENNTAKMVVTGGTFVKFNPANCQAEGKGTNFCAPGYKTELTNGVYVVKSGTNDALEAIDKALKTDATEEDIKAAVDAVASTPNETLANSSTTMDKLAELEKKVTSNKITVETSSNVTEVKAPVAANAKLSADPEATTDQKITIDVTSSDASTDAAKKLVGATDAMAAKGLGITMKLNDQEIEPKAPVVLTFDLPAGWANAQIVYMNGDSTEIVPSTISNGKISGVFNHFSTYVLVQTEKAENANAYELILTPDKANVSAGDTLTYTVSLKHTAGDNGDDISGLRFNLDENAGLKLDTTASKGAGGITFGQAGGNGNYQFNFVQKKSLDVGAAMDIGTLVYTVQDYGNNGDKVTAPVASSTVVTNSGNNVLPGLNVDDGDVTYHEIQLTFVQPNGDKNQYYARYDESGLYADMADMIAGKTTSAPAVNDPESTEYRLVDTYWHAETDMDTIYNATTKNIIDTTYVTNKKNIVKITIPAEGVEIDKSVAVTDRNGDKYIDEGADLIFTVIDPAPGMKNTVTAKIGDGDANEVAPGQDGKYTVPGTSITGDVTITVTQDLDLTAADIKIFTKDSASGIAGYLPYSSYSGDRTLVLIKGAEGVSYTLNDGQPEIFALPAGAYEGGYTHAVLMPAQDIVSEAGMLAALKEAGLQTTNTANKTITYDWKTAGNNTLDFQDVAATYDFKSLTSDNFKWKPTDEQLLKADVMNLTNEDSNVYNQGSYQTQRDGYVTDNDVAAFMYLYAKLAK